MEKVDLTFLQNRKLELEKRIETEKARDAQQTVATLQAELKVTDLAILGLTGNTTLADRYAPRA